MLVGRPVLQGWPRVAGGGSDCNSRRPRGDSCPGFVGCRQYVRGSLVPFETGSRMRAAAHCLRFSNASPLGARVVQGAHLCGRERGLKRDWFARFGCFETRVRGRMRCKVRAHGSSAAGIAIHAWTAPGIATPSGLAVAATPSGSTVRCTWLACEAPVMLLVRGAECFALQPGGSKRSS